MENITLGQIALAVAFLGGLISGFAYLHKQLKTWLSASFKEPFQVLDDKIDKMSGQITEVDMNATKNFLVARLADLEQGQKMNEIETERFWEQYEHYHKIGGNSYIEQKVDKLKNLGKL